MSTTFLSATASCLFTATIALAQLPAPASPTTGSPVVTYSGLEGPVGINAGLPSKCAPAKACTPEVKPSKKVVYSTVTREYCQPSRSLFDILLKKCGLSDDCDGDAERGETQTKTLLVKKVVPSCEKPACLPHDTATMGLTLPSPRIQVYPPRP